MKFFIGPLLLYILLWSGPSVSSLFFKPEEKEAALAQQRIDSRKWGGKDFPLKLGGVFFRPDLQKWTVWINGHRISNDSPQSIQGWTIVSVDFHSIIVRSAQGEEVILSLEQQHLPQASSVLPSPASSMKTFSPSSTRQDFSKVSEDSSSGCTASAIKPAEKEEEEKWED